MNGKLFWTSTGADPTTYDGLKAPDGATRIMKYCDMKSPADWFGSWNVQLTPFEVRGDHVGLVWLADVSFMTPRLTTANQACLADGHDAGTGVAVSKEVIRS